MNHNFEELLMIESKNILEKAIQGQPISKEELQIIELANQNHAKVPLNQIMEKIKDFLPLLASVLGG